MQQISRRKFVAASAAAVSAPWVSRLKAAPSSMITLGFIGTGGHGIAHNLRSFLREKDCRAIAVCDVFQSRKQKAAGIINKT